MKVCSDEEGIKISKGMIAFVTMIMLLLTTVSAAAAYAVGVKSTVENIDQDLMDVKTTLKELTPKINENEKDIAVMKAHYESIDLNIQEIKRKLEAR